MPRRNPTREEDLAAEGYEFFSGKESEKVVLDEFDFPPPQELMVQFGNFLPKLPKWVSALGELHSLSYQRDDPEYGLQDEEIQLFHKPYPLLCSDFKWKSEGYESLFIVGGSYLADEEPDLICGNLIWVDYLACKSFEDFKPTHFQHRFNDSWPILAQNYEGDQLYVIRAESEFSIDRSGNVSGGIAG
jgi:hypothetical protein